MALPDRCRQITDPDDPRRAVVPGYCVRDDGMIFRLAPYGKWVQLKQQLSKGFCSVRIVIGGRPQRMGVAIIVLRAFIGPRPLGFEAFRYPDTDPLNNRVENLRWAPIGSARVGKPSAHVLPPSGRGDAHPQSRFSESEVPMIRDLYRAGFSYTEIAERTNGSPETIRRILVGETFSHVPDPLGRIVMRRPGPKPEECSTAKLGSEQIPEIRRMLAAGVPRKEIAARFQVSVNSIDFIATGRTWKEV